MSCIIIILVIIIIIIITIMINDNNNPHLGIRKLSFVCIRQAHT